jgi:mRNA-degrading endonuclease RelE of RelBE toxin-antitoxin system
MNNLYYKPEAIKALKKLSSPEKKKIVRKLELLGLNPEAGKMLKGKLANLYSLRAWPYRIIYKYEKKKVIVMAIAHRSKVYKLRTLVE